MASTYTQPNFATKVTTGDLSADGNTLTGFPGWGGVSVDNIRRTFAIGDYVSQLAPEQSLFFAYLSKVAKKGLDETVWKPMEYRPQWQRRNFILIDGDGSGNNTALDHDGDDTVADHLGSLSVAAASGVKFRCNYDSTGKKTTAWDQVPVFILVNQVVRLKLQGAATADNGYQNFKITEVTGSGASAKYGLKSVRTDFPHDDDSGASAGTPYAYDLTADAEGQVVGSAFAEASTAPDGWSDQISATEFYMQIFKTSVPLMSGSAQATKYRGFADEYSRIYTQHVLSHKMDIEHAMLFGSGNYVSQDERYSWGIVPFIETQGGKTYEVDASAAGFDYFVDLMRDFFDYESGNSGQKLVLTSRAVIAWLTKMGTTNSNSFLYNTIGMNGAAGNTSAGTAVSGPYGATIDIKQSKFAPVPITAISTAFGTMNFVAHPLFRGHAEDIAVVVDMNNVAYRCLQGNGINRDTFVETNVQDNSVDGRKDQIITECGLEVMMPETHALLKFTHLSSSLA
jgi:hypothetical protein